MENIQHRFACFGADLPWLRNPALFSVGDPPDGGSELTPEHQALEDISPVLHGVLPPIGGEILITGLRHILCQHLKLPSLPIIQVAVNSATDCAGDRHVLVALEDHCQEDN